MHEAILQTRYRKRRRSGEQGRWRESARAPEAKTPARGELEQVSGPEDPGAENAAEDQEARPTRSQRTRAATAVNQLGLELIALSPSNLDQLELPDELRAAIDVCQGLKIRARSRQKRLVGQLLRAEDHETIRHRVESLEGARRIGVAKDRAAERWRSRLIEDGDSALQAFIDEHPGADRQRLRTLARTAMQDPEAAKTKRARRELLRAIRALRT